MEIWPVAGVSGSRLSKALGEAAGNASNASATSGGPDEVIRAYLSWVDTATQSLRPLLRPGDFQRLVLTTRYWATVGYTGNKLAIQQALVEDLRYLARQLDAAQTSVDDRLARWEADNNRERAFVCIIADTNVFMKYPETFAIEDWTVHLPATITDIASVRIVIPILVVDELDGLKKSNDRTNARLALKTIFDLLGSNPRERADVRPTDLNQGGLSVELMFDPPEHNRLAMNDDELIDRAVALKSFIQHDVEFVTYDTGAAFRATAAGLHAHRLIDQEPTSGRQPTRASRRA